MQRSKNRWSYLNVIQSTRSDILERGPYHIEKTASNPMNIAAQRLCALIPFGHGSVTLERTGFVDVFVWNQSQEPVEMVDDSSGLLNETRQY